MLRCGIQSGLSLEPGISQEYVMSGFATRVPRPVLSEKVVDILIAASAAISAAALFLAAAMAF
jgi:hypothetical protein